ncbi:protein timeless isoform X2 [Culicoides brevitarsis]|uniref:protein timeless isoform X2 n=1 Tax=Culicoides brevitarsis TaxID=469753 RepID=UPI00307B8108
MQWLLANPQIRSTFASLGEMQNDRYVVNEDCSNVLREIIYKLSVEDHTLRTYRRAIGFGHNIKNDLIPLLINAYDGDIVDLTIRLLVNLTVPIECVLSVDVMSRSEVGRHTIFELNHLLISAKQAFAEPHSTKAVIERMTNILESDTKLSLEQCDNINNCLLLLRNVLHISETNYTGSVNLQSRIIWNLFTQSFDKLLLHLMTCAQRAYWSVTVVQMIALLYKDQQFSTLQKLLNVWFETSLSESSEDNESNTSPPKPSSGDSSPMLTSDPTSDSSDTGQSSNNLPQAKNCFMSKRFIAGGHGGGGKSSGGSQNSDEITSMDFQNSVIRIKPFVKKPSQLSLCTDDSIDGVSSNDRRRSSGFGSIDDQSVFSTEDKTNIGETTTTATNPVVSAAPIVTTSTSTNTTNTHQMCMSTSSGIESSNSSQTSKTKKYQQSSQMILKNNKKTQIKQELSDCGYGTQIENQESISTSSNEDEFINQKIHQKPPPNQKQRYNAANKQRNPKTIQDKKEIRRKKLVKRSRSSIINMKGMADYNPTEDDISNVLKEFTVDFLLKGYRFLVKELHIQLLNNVELQIDTSHFFWLVTYFLKFAAQLELDIDHINSVLSYEVLSYLTYEGVNLCEQIQCDSKVAGTDLKPSLRRMHLVITAIREFIYSLEVYNKSTHLTNEDKEYLKILRIKIANTSDLKNMFVLLLRLYVPTLHNRQYLQDLVTTNHQLLLLLDDVTKMPDYKMGAKDKQKDDKMLEHIKQFATVDVMYHYGLLLENFKDNGEFVNDCIFTMMHHVGGDLGQASILFQPNILKTYSRIWESEYSICDDWSDLIEFVIHKFINTPQQTPTLLPHGPILVKPAPSIAEPSIWTKEEMDSLYWYYIQSKFCTDIIGNIISLFKTNLSKQRSRIDVIQQLLKQDIITSAEFDKLMTLEDSEYEQNTRSPAPTTTNESNVDSKDESKPIDDIKVLTDRLLKQDKGKLVQWLQRVLMECCFIKLRLEPQVIPMMQNDEFIMEPVPHHCILKNQSIPLVPWNSEQHLSLVYQPFVLLLHKLGFHLPDDTNKIWACIPNFWTADILFQVADKLGPIDESAIKFNMGRFSQMSKANLESECIHDTHSSSSSQFSVPRPHKVKSLIRYTPDLSTPSHPKWMRELVPDSDEIMLDDETILGILSKDDEVTKHYRHNTPPWATNQVPPINIIALQSGSSSNALSINIDDDAQNIETAGKMKQLCIQVPYATTSPANPIWIQDIMRAKAGTSDGLMPRDFATPNGHILNSEQLLMLVRGDTPVCSGNTETTTTDRITSTTNCDALKQATTVLTTVKTDFPMVVECGNINDIIDEQTADIESHKSVEIIDMPALIASPLKQSLETVSEEQEIVSICDTASVASDLTRMYVSDEDERHSVDMQVPSSSNLQEI